MSRHCCSSVEDIEVRYGAIKALKGVSFEVDVRRDRRAARRERGRQDHHPEDGVRHAPAGAGRDPLSRASGSTASRRTT